jgi:hypothetical protein
MTPHAQPLGWVRAASSSAKSMTKPDVDGADILLESPANARREAPKQWKLAPPTFSQPRAEKRMTEEIDMEENDPLLSDLVSQSDQKDPLNAGRIEEQLGWGLSR